MEGWDIYISTCPRPSFYLAWACTSTSPLRDLGSLPLRLVVTPPFLFPSSVPFLPRRSSLRAPSLRSFPSFPPSLPSSFLSFLRFTPTRDKGPRTMGGLLLGGKHAGLPAHRPCVATQLYSAPSSCTLRFISCKPFIPPVLYRLPFGQREGVSRVWFTLVYVVLSSGHRWMGDILVFTEGVLRELGEGGRQFGLAGKCHESSNIYFSRYVYRPRVRLRRD